jgi:hypothetical protein
MLNIVSKESNCSRTSLKALTFKTPLNNRYKATKIIPFNSILGKSESANCELMNSVIATAGKTINV